ncbi:MAG: P-type conjugative transfer protein TrbJ [Pseudomonadota bacterium]
MCRRIIAVLMSATALSFVAPQPADALFGVGDVVIDPTNLVQNVNTAVNTLEQINNQIRQLQNEAQMLIDSAENLKRLDQSSINELRRILERIDVLMREGDEITYEVEESERRYEENFPESYEDLTNREIVVRATDQWKLSRGTFGNAVRIQSAIVSSITESKETLTALVNQSQDAAGNLEVIQAGNQLMALSVEQQMHMQQLMASHYRMLAVEQARRAAIEEQSRVRHERFRGDGSAYTRD